MDGDSKDVEAGTPTRIPPFKQIFDLAGITPEVQKWDYEGSGTEDDPYVVGWIDNDPRNPMLYSAVRKWTITVVCAVATLAVSFASSAYSGGSEEVIKEFGCSQEVSILGVSLFVLGFAIGPLLWAPLSELYGRQILFFGTYGALTAFSAGSAGAQNIWSLIILRFFAGAFGSSPLTNAGGVIADMFPARQRGLAMSIFATAPFMGPVLGPIVGGFVGETIGWRWIEGVIAIFAGVVWMLGALVIPETYPPVLQRHRAKKLSQLTGKVYRTRGDIDQGPTTPGHVFKTSLSRPWILLFREPIVFLLSTYMAVVYGTLYMLFGAFPIVYQQQRGWSAGIGGLAFLGVAVGMLLAVAYSIWDNKRYARISDANKGFAPPEARLPACMLGGACLPVGLIWFAWTNYPSFPFMASIAAGVPFGFGMVLVFLSIMNYLIDAYTIFAASVLAASAVLRSLFGTAFPLFTTQMYGNLGIHWASMVPAFLALACVPFPFLFYKYGAKIREKCKYAAQAAAFMKQLQSQADNENDDEVDQEEEDTTSEAEKEKHYAELDAEKEADRERRMEREEEEEQEAFDYSYEQENANRDSGFQAIRTQSRPAGLSRVGTSTSRRSAKSARSTASRNVAYDWSPFDLDRVNTRESFRREAKSISRASSRNSSRQN